MNLQDRCRTLIESGLTLAEIARCLEVKPGRVRQWKLRWKRRGVTLVTKESVTLTPQWMRSLSFDWAHFVKADGVAACGAKVPLGGDPWHDAEETRRCTRCQGHESGTAGTKVYKPHRNKVMSKLDEALKRRGVSYGRPRR